MCRTLSKHVVRAVRRWNGSKITWSWGNRPRCLSQGTITRTDLGLHIYCNGEHWHESLLYGQDALRYQKTFVGARAQSPIKMLCRHAVLRWEGCATSDNRN